MTDWAFRLYRALPIPARSIAASARGFYLRGWRYGADTEQLVLEALEREHWSQGEWKSWRENRLAYLLHRSARDVPYYRDLWAKRRRSGDTASWEYLENWPILEKGALRETPRAFVAEDQDTRRMFHEHTSGTSGTPISLWWSRKTVREWYALFEARWRRWYDVSRFDRWAILGGQVVTPVSQVRPPFWVWNSPLQQLYMSSYHLAPAMVPYYLDALVQRRIEYLWGYTSALHALAQQAIRMKRTDIRMKVAITNAEPVMGFQREAIARAFQCPVRETYGMAEIVAAASECESGQMHLWPEAGIVEVMEGEVPALSGDFVCTGLFNPDMPLIRYRVGDRGVRPDGDHTGCSCGRTLPLLQSIDGRMDDTLYTSDGRRIGRLDPVFKDGAPIREAQIIQEALDRIRVRFIPAEEYTDEAGELLVKRIHSRLGHVSVVLESVEAIPRTANGKFRAVICALPDELRRSLEGGTSL